MENETMEMFNMGERSKSKHKFGGKSAKLTREYFANPKIENEALPSV